MARAPAIIALLGCAAVLSAACPAYAGDDADELVERGLSLRMKGDDEGALSLFEAAYAKAPSARLLAQIGFAEQALGRWVAAENHIMSALSASRSSSWVTQYRPAIEKALETIRNHIGTLDVVASVQGARVEVDGTAAGVLPLPKPLRLASGTVVLTVRSSGYAPFERKIAIRGGVAVQERIVLVPLGDVGRPPANALVEARDEESSLRTWAWISAGTAAVGLGTGLIATRVRNDKIAQYNDDSICLTGPGTRQEKCGGLRAAGDRAQAIAIAGWITGGLAATTAVVLFLQSGAHEDTDLSVEMRGGPGTVSAALRGRF